jgi:uncharacterized protein YegJ (DUF2314 family)
VNRKLIPLAVVLAAAALMGSCNRAGAQADEAPMQWRKNDDAEMNAAVAEARRTLPVFRRLFDEHPVDIDLFLIKAGFKTAHGGSEHVWLYDLAWKDGSVSGVLANEPEDVPNMHAGDRVTASEDMISDWAYRKQGKFYGQYTTRVMIKTESPADAAEESQTLWPTPLEPGRQ